MKFAMFVVGFILLILPGILLYAFVSPISGFGYLLGGALARLISDAAKGGRDEESH